MPKKILIADDSEYHRATLQQIIPQEYSIVEADTGMRARALFETEQPDLVFLDIVMPEGEEEGVQVLRDLKRANPNAKVVMISALGANRTIDACKKFGVVDYIEKPFDKKVVLSILEQCFGE
jgi:two-component system, chemotaxis family, chemotaxis protein CheY